MSELKERTARVSALPDAEALKTPGEVLAPLAAGGTAAQSS